MHLPVLYPYSERCRYRVHGFSGGVRMYDCHETWAAKYSSPEMSVQFALDRVVPAKLA
jgi:hypothetical protein